MTIITKPITEKKNDKLILPLVENDQLAANAPLSDDAEAQSPEAARFVILRARARRVSTTTTLCLLLTSLAVVGIGIIGGTYLYRQYLRAQIFKGWCSIPYDPINGKAALRDPMDYDSDDNRLSDSKLFKSMKESDEEARNLERFINSYFHEQFELDINNEDYEKIDVPDFKDGRKGRFIHDFNTNKTGIIDTSAKRCFVMPMNRDNVLPPRSLFDLIHKMWDGYYNVDTKVIRETMRVVVPPVTDMSDVGSYIERECRGMPIYKLEKSVGGIVKRSADLEDEAKFALFSGKNILEFDIVNIHEARALEENQQ